MLVTSIFSFSHNVFFPYPKQISFFQSYLFCHLQMLSIRTSLNLCRLVKNYYCKVGYTCIMGSKTEIRSEQTLATLATLYYNCYSSHSRTKSDCTQLVIEDRFHQSFLRTPLILLHIEKKKTVENMSFSLYFVSLNVTQLLIG